MIAFTNDCAYQMNVKSLVQHQPSYSLIVALATKNSCLSLPASLTREWRLKGMC